MNGLTLNPLNKSDIDEIVLVFKNLGWHKPKSIYDTYLEEQISSLRSVFIARANGKFCGYVTIKWMSDYRSFAEQSIPEISDLNVLPENRNQGIGTRLIIACEDLARERKLPIIGLGVGLVSDYGNAQRLYIHLGYVPDKGGLHYKSELVSYDQLVKADDDLVLYLTKKL